MLVGDGYCLFEIGDALLSFVEAGVASSHVYQSLEVKARFERGVLLAYLQVVNGLLVVLIFNVS